MFKVVLFLYLSCMKLQKTKEVIQSYVLSSAKYDFSVHEKRILFSLVELCQAELEGKKLDANFSISEKFIDDAKVVEVPITKLLKHEKDKNHKLVKDALRNLVSKLVEYEEDDVWKCLTIIERPEIRARESYISFKVHREIYNVILDFSKGHRKYILELAMSFKSVYSMRFYELFSNKKEPITYSLGKLKEIFQIEGKYTRVNDFTRKVLEPAQKELNKHSPYSFEFEPIKKSRKITGFKFTPKFIEANQPKDIKEKDASRDVSLRWDLSRTIMDCLMNDYGFSKRELNNNKLLFQNAVKHLPFLDFLKDVLPRTRQKRNPKGYLISSIKSELDDILIQIPEEINDSEESNSNSKETQNKDITDVQAIIQEKLGKKNQPVKPTTSAGQRLKEKLQRNKK